MRHLEAPGTRGGKDSSWPFRSEVKAARLGKAESGTAKGTEVVKDGCTELKVEIL